MSHVPGEPQGKPTLEQRMAALGIRPEDLEESFVQSGGRGGQNVNKVATCVLLVHRPTGVQVKCQTSRYQGVNRELAREMLVQKLESERARELAGARQVAEKLRRQKRGRSRAAKQRMLADKSRHATKKEGRRRVERD